MSVSTPPRLSASACRRTAFSSRRAASSEPRSKASMPAEARHLLPGELVLRMRRQTRVVDPRDLRMGAQELRQGLAVGAVLLHPQRQRLGAAKHQPRIERPQDGAFGVLHEPQPLDVVVADRDDDAADAVAMSVEVLRRTVRHQIGAELDRPLDAGTGEGVVHDEPDVVAMREIRRRPQVRDAHHRIGGRLDEQHPCRRRERALDVVKLRRVHVTEGQAVALQHLVEQAEGAAVRVVGHDDVVAGLQQRGDGADRRHAGREGEPGVARLDRCEVAPRAPCASDSACARIRTLCGGRTPPARRSTFDRSG